VWERIVKRQESIRERILPREGEGVKPIRRGPFGMTANNKVVGRDLKGGARWKEKLESTKDYGVLKNRIESGGKKGKEDLDWYEKEKSTEKLWKGVFIAKKKRNSPNRENEKRSSTNANIKNGGSLEGG